MLDKLLSNTSDEVALGRWWQSEKAMRDHRGSDHNPVSHQHGNLLCQKGLIGCLLRGLAWGDRWDNPIVDALCDCIAVVVAHLRDDRDLFRGKRILRAWCPSCALLEIRHSLGAFMVDHQCRFVLDGKLHSGTDIAPLSGL